MNGLDEIILIVNKKLGINITYDNKTKLYVDGKKAYVFLSLKVTPFSDEIISDKISRDRTTIIYYRKEFESESFTTEKAIEIYKQLLPECQYIKDYYINLDTPSQLDSIINDVRKELNKLIVNNYINKKTKRKFSNFIIDKLEEIKRLENDETRNSS